ncbi:TIGR03773 family transporter-associated surface protein [Buchananella hordeovulneris]|uniref:TIGR03773 family transporter-associated surface protein n=1 Tax=Buchananella hordeovulneris TaxID=52770 RepID=UPI0013011EC7|nr:TIGR03773 family transporter-associated surface protein [Buchananella hordeovulneris]
MRAFLLPALLCPALALTPAAAGVGPQETTATAPVILATGHVDLVSGLENGNLVTRVLHDTKTGEVSQHAVEDTVLVVANDSRQPVPADAPAVLGQGEVWLLPPQESSTVQLGWSTQELPGPVTWSLQAATGPGQVALYRSAAAGPEVLWNSGDGVTAADSFQIDSSRGTGSWAFTAPGVYCLQFTRAAEVDGQAQSVTSTLAVAVDSDPAGVSGHHCTPSPQPQPAPPTSAPSDAPTADPSSEPTTPPAPTPTASPSAQPTVKPTPTAKPTPTTKPTPSLTPRPRPSASPPRPPRPAPWRPVPNRSVNARGATVLNTGHIDVASLLVNGRLQTVIKDTTQGGQPRWLSPARTVLQVLPAAWQRVPAVSAQQLGLRQEFVYLLPQSQDQRLLWPGWSTEHIPGGQTPGGVSWGLTDVRGPGHFVLFESDAFGRAKPLLSSIDGVNEKDRMVIGERTHAHGSWVFTAPGSYCLGMARTARTADGQVVSDTFYLHVAVGETDVTHLDPQSCAQSAAPAPRPGPQPGRPGNPGGNQPHPPGGNQPSNPGAPGNPSRPPFFPPPRIAPPPPPPPPSSPRGPRGPVGRPAVPGAAPRSCQVQLPILEAGHIDYATQLNGGQLQSVIGDDTSGNKVFRDPGKVVLWLKPSARVQLPGGFAQVGAPGAAIWQIPQTQKPDLIWLGWSTESLTSASAAGPVEWTINSVDGPGRLTVYLTGAFGGVQEVVFSGPGSYRIPLGVHAHANWAFSAEGVYRINSTQTVTLPSGQRVSDTETMTIVVGDVDPQSVATVHDCSATSASGGLTPGRAAGVTGLPALPTDADGFKAAPQAHALAAGAAPTVAPTAKPGAARPFIREALAQVAAASAEQPAAVARQTGAVRQDERLIAHLLIILGGALSAGSVTLSVLRRRLR